MPIITNHINFSGDFTMLPNSWIRDARLSHRARGVLAVVSSHSNGWETSISYLVKEGKEGRDAIYSAIEELVSAGYLVRVEARTVTGKFDGVNYEVNDPFTENPKPLPEKPYTGNPHTEKPYTGNPQQENNNLKKNSIKENQPKNGAPQASPAGTNRGTRVPEDFMPAQKHIDKIRAMKPGLALDIEHTKFMNYWLAATGTRATKKDWGRTWENWMLNAKEEQGYKPGWQKRLEYNAQVNQQYQEDLGAEFLRSIER